MPELDGEVRNESIPDGLLDAVSAQNRETYARNGTPERANTDPAATGQTGTQTKTQNKNLNTNEAAAQAIEDPEEEEAGGDNAEGLDSQDYSHQVPATEEATEDNNEATTDLSQTNTETNNTQSTDDDWKNSLPTAPVSFQLEPPKPDDLGQIDPLEYTTYVKEAAKAEMRQEQYNQTVITRSFEEAEKILPELKTNPVVQNLVRQSYLAQIANGDPTVVVNIARDVKTLLGGAKAEGANNAKTSITIQKNATVETKGATQKKVTTPPKDKALDKRLARNDTTAFEELMGGWMADGKV